MSLAEEFVALVEEIDRRTPLPPIADFHLPRPMDDPDRVAAFGALLLEDGSCGFFSAWLGEAIEDLETLDRQALVGRPPLEIARWYAGDDPVRSAVGFAAVNAASQHLFRANGYPLDTATNSLGALDFREGDRVGMVGFFPPLVRRLVERGIDLVVIEKQDKFSGMEEGCRVSFDPVDLEECNKVLCTASTLLNSSTEEILSHCGADARVAVIGPTAGSLPDPLFARGVDILGGSVAIDTRLLMDRLRRGDEWGESVKKYCIRREGYPGFRELLRACA